MEYKKRLISHFILFVFTAFTLTSCWRVTVEDLEMAEMEKISNYLKDNPSLNFTIKESGLYYLETVTGTGPAPVNHDTAYIFYTAKLLDETVLETNADTDDTLIFPVGENYLIKGLEEGVTYMREGGKALFLLPSKLAYGSSGNYYTIGGYTPLLFDVELVRVKPGPGKK